MTDSTSAPYGPAGEEPQHEGPEHEGRQHEGRQHEGRQHEEFPPQAPPRAASDAGAAQDPAVGRDAVVGPDAVVGADAMVGPDAMVGADPVAGPSKGAKRDKAPKKQASLWRELPVLVVVAVALAFVFKTFFIAVFFIPSASMEHTLIGQDSDSGHPNTGDRVVVNKLVYDFRDPHRGEIVVFNGKTTNFRVSSDTQTPTTGTAHAIRKALSVIGLGSDPNESDYIKRVIAIGGDTVGCPGVAGDANKCLHVVVNGHAVDESSYLFEGTMFQLPYQATFATCTVPQGDLFVMGDHRDDSEDSRPNGPIPVGAVVGRAFAKVYPFTRAGGLSVPKVWQASFTPTSAAHTGAPLCQPLPPGQ